MRKYPVQVSHTTEAAKGMLTVAHIGQCQYHAANSPFLEVPPC
jgi:hypothetical protein